MKQNLTDFIKTNILPITFIGCLAIFTGLAVTYGIIMPYRASGQAYKTDNATVAAQPADVNPRTAAVSFADTVEKVAPSVVTIRADIVKKDAGREMPPFFNDPMFRQFFGDRLPQVKPQPRTEHALGSGVIVGADGTILTNNHVIAGADKIKVEFADRRSFDAKVVGTDPLSDLAVLKIDAKDLPALPLGDSDRVRVGDVVLAIGNPLGLQQTVTSGIISAKGRQTGLSDGSFEDFLQTDAPINQGNSGGALVNLSGRLIGINSQILSPSGGNIGIGFAIPSNMARSVMEQLIKTGKVHRGMLGIGIQNLNSDLAENFGLKDLSGVLVNSVAAGSPAEKAGIKQGDVVTAVDGEKVGDTNALRNRIANLKPGTEVALTVMRSGRETELKAVLTEYTPPQTTAGTDDGNDRNAPADPDTGGKLGITVQPLTPEIAGQIGLTNVSEGMVITGVEPGSRAEDAGLQQGDVIMQINRQAVNSPADVKNALAKSGNKAALFLINRRNQTFFMTIKTD